MPSHDILPNRDCKELAHLLQEALEQSIIQGKQNISVVTDSKPEFNSKKTFEMKKHS